MSVRSRKWDGQLAVPGAPHVAPGLKSGSEPTHSNCGAPPHTPGSRGLAGDPVETFLGKLRGVRETNGAWSARCPAHDDRRASLSVGRGDDGRALLHCHAGCSVDAIVMAVGLEMTDLFVPSLNGNGQGGADTEIAYNYVDEQGVLLFQVVRKPGKKFPIRRPGPDGEWIWKLEDTRRVLYRLPEVLAAPPDVPVYIGEGEKDVETLRGLGLVATTNPLGANSWQPEFNEAFRGRPVVILPDNDEAGQKHAQDVARGVYPLAASTRILNLPGLREKGDVTDWVRQGGVREELERLVGKAPLWDPAAKAIVPPTADGELKPELTSILLEDLLALPVVPRERLLEPWLRAKDLAMIYAFRGVGKTWISLGIALAVSSGKPFLKWNAPKPRLVLLVDGEMPYQTLRERSAALCRGGGFDPEGRFRIICADLQDGVTPNIATPEGQAAIEKHLDGIELVIFDNLSCLCGSIVENESDSWEPIQRWLLSLRRRGITVVFMHHAGKGGDQRGASKKEDVLDVSILLKTPRDYDSQEGARFEVHFKKARGLAGPDVASFQATAQEQSDKGMKWATQDLADQVTEEIIGLHEEGKAVREIAKIIGLNASNVSRRLTAAREAGRLHPEGAPK